MDIVSLYMLGVQNCRMHHCMDNEQQHAGCRSRPVGSYAKMITGTESLRLKAPSSVGVVKSDTPQYQSVAGPYHKTATGVLA